MSLTSKTSLEDITVKLIRFSRVGAVLAVGALLLTACGSDDNTSSDGTSGSTPAPARRP